jgi:phage tail-like protein
MVAFGGNIALTAVTGALGIRSDPYMGFNFLVEIEGLLVGGFRNVSGLESSIDVYDYTEGGVNGYQHKLPGATRYPNLVLSKGLTDGDGLWGWYDEVSRGKIIRRNVTIMVLDAQRIPAMWWDIREALPVKWTGPTFNAASGNEVAIESMELVHKGITKPPENTILRVARAGLGALSLTGSLSIK